MSYLARDTDPHTSHEAAKAIGNLNNSEKDVLYVARKMADFTDEELVDQFARAVKVGFVRPVSPQRIRTARSQLERRGLIVPTLLRRPSQYGRDMTVWSAA